MQAEEHNPAKSLLPIPYRWFPAPGACGARSATNTAPVGQTPNRLRELTQLQYKSTENWGVSFSDISITLASLPKETYRKLDPPVLV